LETDGVCRSNKRDVVTRGSFGGLQSVAGGGAFFVALGLAGGRTRAGFGGSRP